MIVENIIAVLSQHFPALNISETDNITNAAHNAVTAILFNGMFNNYKITDINVYAFLNIHEINTQWLQIQYLVCSTQKNKLYS